MSLKTTSLSAVVTILLASIILPSGVSSARGAGKNGQALPGLYVALGDSYSSGEGLKPYANEQCHESAAAWPHYVVPAGVPHDFLSLACSGAKLSAMFETFKGQNSQLSLLLDLNGERRSVPYQLGPIDFVTITIGGNNIGFSKILRGCFILTCLSYSQFNDVVHQIQALQPHLEVLYREMRRLVPSVPIAVVGYPRIFPTSQPETTGCGWLTPRERVRLNELTALLDNAEREAAQVAGVEFISTLNALHGHELCTRQPWLFPIGKAPLVSDAHPNANGQQAIAQVVRGQAPDFSISKPPSG